MLFPRWCTATPASARSGSKRAIEPASQRDGSAFGAGALQRRQHFEYAGLHLSRREGRHAPAQPVAIIDIISHVGL